MARQAVSRTERRLKRGSEGQVDSGGRGGLVSRRGDPRASAGCGAGSGWTGSGGAKGGRGSGTPGSTDSERHRRVKQGVGRARAVAGRSPTRMPLSPTSSPETTR
jgi:hypothetical protein